MGEWVTAKLRETAGPGSCFTIHCSLLFRITDYGSRITVLSLWTLDFGHWTGFLPHLLHRLLLPRKIVAQVTLNVVREDSRRLRIHVKELDPHALGMLLPLLLH